VGTSFLGSAASRRLVAGGSAIAARHRAPRTDEGGLIGALLAPLSPSAVFPTGKKSLNKRPKKSDLLLTTMGKRRKHSEAKLAAIAAARKRRHPGKRPAANK
jgi:hypothetical protein